MVPDRRPAAWPAGVRYLLQKYCTRAQASVPALRTKRLHPHSMRHSTAVHLLRAGVDIVTISHWLGHASVTTTHRYATVDLDMKRQALAKARPPPAPLRGRPGGARTRRCSNGSKRSEEAIGNVESGDLRALGTAAVLRRDSTLLITQH